MSSPTPSTTSAPDEITEERPNAQFPWKLHALLTEAEARGHESIVSWLPHGKAFKVHNKIQFASKVLPLYFNATKYKSFQRNLNLWGFESITDGPYKGGCFHSSFVRGEAERCHGMTRQKVKSSVVKSSKDSGIQNSNSKESDQEVARQQTKAFSSSSNLSSAPGGMFVNEKTESTRLRSLEKYKESFPSKLHEILSSNKYQHVIAWTSDGRCIRIIEASKFQGEACPRYFGHSSYETFLNDMQRFGFKKVKREAYDDCYIHDMMIRGYPHLTKYISTPEDARRFETDDFTEVVAIDRSNLASLQSLRPLSAATTALSTQSGSASTQLANAISQFSTPLLGQPQSLLTASALADPALQQQIQQQNILSRLSTYGSLSGLLSSPTGAVDAINASTASRISDLAATIALQQQPSSSTVQLPPPYQIQHLLTSLSSPAAPQSSASDSASLAVLAALLAGQQGSSNS